MDTNDIIIFLLLFFSSFLLNAILVPIMKKIGAVQFERDEVKEKRNKEGTPRGAGILFLLPLISLFFNKIREAQFLGFSIFLFAMLGLIDDIITFVKKGSKGLSISLKLILYSIVTILLFLLFKDVIKFETVIFGKVFSLPSYLYFLLYFVIFVGSVNAFNLTDGVDGLLGTISIPMLLTVFVITNGFVKEFSLYLIAPLIAFLWFNSNKASIFMGDVGAASIGAAFASMAILGNFEIIYALIAIIPLVEAITDFIQIFYFRATKGKRFFKMAPIHHHFEIIGWSETKIVYRFAIITSIFCLLAILIH